MGQAARNGVVGAKPSIDLRVLAFVARALIDHLKNVPLTIEEPAPGFYVGDADTDPLELQLGRIVKLPELMQARSACRKVMDKVVIRALDSLRDTLNAELMKVANNGETRSE
jgi:hypothetical protein